jgi:hypothetical protein
MFGDLNQPPVVIRRSRAKAMLMTAFSVVFGAGGAIALFDPAQRHLGGQRAAYC